MSQPTVLFEDNHLLILNKPTGWLVQGDRTGDLTLTDWGQEYIKRAYNKPGAVFLHPTHRLDRPVSGITIFARTSKALERMNRLFHNDQIHKKYLTIVERHPDETKARLEHWLLKNKEKNRVKAYRSEKEGAKKSLLDYELIGADGKLALLMVSPITGRSHQIRVQLSTIHCPISGDLKYGAKQPNQDKSIHLHAFQISFVHPVKKELLTITSVPNWNKFENIIHELDQ